MPVATTNEIDFKALLAQAEEYDRRGLYRLSDKVMKVLQKHFDSLPLEVKLRVQSPHNVPQSMSGYERGNGDMYLKGGLYAYESGKGQAAYRDELPLDRSFI